MKLDLKCRAQLVSPRLRVQNADATILVRPVRRERLMDRKMLRVPFNVPGVAGRELDYLSQVIARRQFAGNGEFTVRCHDWLRTHLGVSQALLTHSCTAALELAMLLTDIQPGDEVIMPSFTFVATATAVVLRGAAPVFVDIRPDTLNIDETRIEAAITPRTKAICVIHYAGVCAEMDSIRSIAERHRLTVIEDAAQALLSSYKGIAAGCLGTLGCFSFHESKNISSGEGGALTVTKPELVERAFIVWEKGTNRQAFQRGLVDHYRWVDVGSSFLPSEFMAAILYAQLENAEVFTQERLSLWQRYHAGFADLEAAELARLPIVPRTCEHNGHLFYLLLRDRRSRDALIERLRKQGIQSCFHYVPLHNSPAGMRYGHTVAPFRSQMTRVRAWFDCRSIPPYRQQSKRKSLTAFPQAVARLSRPTRGT